MLAESAVIILAADKNFRLSTFVLSTYKIIINNNRMRIIGQIVRGLIG